MTASIIKLDEITKFSLIANIIAKKPELIFNNEMISGIAIKFFILVFSSAVDRKSVV